MISFLYFVMIYFISDDLIKINAKKRMFFFFFINFLNSHTHKRGIKPEISHNRDCLNRYNNRVYKNSKFYIQIIFIST